MLSAIICYHAPLPVALLPSLSTGDALSQLLAEAQAKQAAALQPCSLQWYVSRVLPGAQAAKDDAAARKRERRLSGPLGRFLHMANPSGRRKRNRQKAVWEKTLNAGLLVSQTAGGRRKPLRRTRLRNVIPLAQMQN